MEHGRKVQQRKILAPETQDSEVEKREALSEYSKHPIIINVLSAAKWSISDQCVFHI